MIVNGAQRDIALTRMARGERAIDGLPGAARRKQGQLISTRNQQRANRSIGVWQSALQYQRAGAT